MDTEDYFCQGALCPQLVWEGLKEQTPGYAGALCSGVLWVGECLIFHLLLLMILLLSYKCLMFSQVCVLQIFSPSLWIVLIFLVNILHKNRNVELMRFNLFFVFFSFNVLSKYLIYPQVLKLYISFYISLISFRNSVFSSCI